MDPERPRRVDRTLVYHTGPRPQTWPDRENVGPDDDDAGGSGVREPRTPLPVDGSAAAELTGQP